MKYFLSALSGGILGAILVLLVTGLGNKQPIVQEKPVVPVSVSETGNDSKNTTSSPSDTVPDAVEKIFPSVVYIDTKTFTEVERPVNIFGVPAYRSQVVPKQGSGSGVIIDESGLILTNDHVVHGANEIIVTFSDNKSYPATIQGHDTISDLALLKVSVDNLKAAKLGDSDKMRIGESVIAVGSPYHFQHTVTSGVLSGRNRNISDQSKDLQDLLQTDASINPGNSGGPLVNLKGEVIGINTAIIPYAQGIGFAIPINTVKNIVAQLKEHGKVIRPYIGVVMHDLNPKLSEYLGYNSDEGVVVVGVMPNSPAAYSGLNPKDIITEINGTKAKDSEEIRGIIKKSKIGETITLKVWRSGTDGVVKIKVGSRDK